MDTASLPHAASSVATLRFRAVEEASPGPKLAALFAAHWPAYCRWFKRDGDAARPTYGASRRMLGRHMPEIVPLYDRIVALVGGGNDEARFLALVNPPPFIAGCAQAALTQDRPTLVRNYDYRPEWCDAVLLATAWDDVRVIAMTDCLWGVLDGMNDRGLAVSLTYGARRAVGEGFGVTLVQRYLLQTCADVPQACAALQCLPVQLAYNLTLLDRGGNCVTAWIGPGRAARIVSTPVAVNRQGAVEWPAHARAWDTERRERVLEDCLRDAALSPERLRGEFLRAPLFRPMHSGGWGTLYTTTYLPGAGAMRCDWLDGGWSQRFDNFTEATHVAHYPLIAAAPEESS